MAKLDRAHSKYDLADIDSGKANPKSVLNKAKNRLSSSESLRGAADGKNISDVNKEQAELKVLDEVSSTLEDLMRSNPNLAGNSLLQKRRQELREITNPEDVKRVMQNIGSWRNDLNEIYGDLITDNDNDLYFRKRADQWISMHRSLSIQDQAKWIKDVPFEREKRKQPFDALEATIKNVDGLSGSQKRELIQVFHEYMADHGRRENVKYADRIKDNVSSFNKLVGKLPNLTKEEKEQCAQDFLNISEAQQKVELAKLKELTETQELDETFKQFKKERQAEHKGFPNLPKQEKLKVLNKMTKALTREYSESFNQHKGILAAGDLKLFEETIRRKDIALLEESLKEMPNVIRKAEEVDTKSKKLKKKFAEKLSEEEIKQIFKLVAWDSPFTTTLDRKKLLEGKVIEGMLKREEVELREANVKKYDDKIDNKVGEGAKQTGDKHTLMHKKGRDANKAWFKKLDTKKQNKIIATRCEVDKSIEKRKKINKRFAKLPETVQKELHNVYANIGMEEREALCKKVEALRKKNEKIYQKQLKKAGRDSLIPQTKAAEEKLLEEFQKLSNKDQVDRREKDKTITGNPALKAAILSFKGAFLDGNIPPNIYEQALHSLNTSKIHAHERIIYIKTFLAQHYQPGHTELHAKMEEMKEVELEDLENKQFRDDMVDKEEEEGKEALENGNVREALEHYEKASDMDEDREDLQILREVLEDSEYKDAPIPPHIMEQGEEVFDNLVQNPQIKNDMKMFRLMDESIYRIGISERQHQNIKEASDRSMEALKTSGADEETLQLQEELSEFQEGKADDKKKVLVQEKGDLQAKDLIELKFSSRENDLAGTDPEKIEKQRAVIKELKDKQGGNEGSDRLAFKDENGNTIKSEEMQRKRDINFGIQMQTMSKIIEDQMIKKGTSRTLAKRTASQIVSHKFEKLINEIDLKDLEG